MVLLYVVPLTLSVGFLAWVGLPGLALALLAVETLVSAAVVQAKAPPGRGLQPPAIALGVLGAAAGAGATVLLSGV